jgi:WD40 repeat protein
MSTAVSQTGNPFPGLRSFEREQAHLFFGRDEQTRDLVKRLRRHRFLPIVGMSGSGKSSLVRAGLIPALTGSYLDSKTSGWRIAVLRPGGNPMQELAATLCRAFAVADSEAVLRTLRSSTAGLARIARQCLGSGEKLLVLVDQFEELFRYEEANVAGEKNDASAFVKLLLAAAGETEHPLPGLDALPVYVVTTMRSDFLGKCSLFRGLPEALNHSQYLIPRLTRSQQRDVIEGPIGMAGSSIEPALVQRLLNDLGDNPDQLPALQHALMRTWEQSTATRDQGKAITVADYEAVGGMADALNRDADRVYEHLSKSEVTKTISRRLFQRLVQPGGPDSETRSPTPFSELVAITDADEGEVKRVITVFQERGFLTVSHDQDPVIDITHEGLIRGWGRLTTWVQEEARSAAIYRRLAETAALYAAGEASLLVDPQLQLTLNWREETGPNEAWASRYDSRFGQAMEFLEQSRKEQQNEIERVEVQRRSQLMRTRLIALVLGTLLLLVIGVSIFAAIQWKRAIAERKNAVAESKNAIAERDRSSRLLYDSNIYFANSAVALGQFTLAQERLDELQEVARELRGFEWFYLWRAVYTHGITLSGHSGSVSSVAFSPDGKTLASASGDQTVKLWDIATRKELATLSGHSGVVTSVAFAPDGKILASANGDTTVKLWDIVTRKELATLSGHSGTVISVGFAPNGKTLASASTDNTVKMWDIATRKELATLVGHYGNVLSVAFAPDGKTLASASTDGAVKLWDFAKRKELATLVGHTAAVPSVAFAPDGKTLASASADKTVKLWDIATRKELATLSGHSSYVSSVAFAPDGRTLASASFDKTVKLWDIAARKELATFSAHSGAFTSVAFAPDGETLASASFDNTVKLWNLADRELATLSGHSDNVSSVAFAPDGEILASASTDKTVKLWDIATRKELVTLSGHSGSVLSVAFSPDGKTLASASADKTVKLWDIAAHKELATLSGHSDYIRSVAFAPDGKILASASADRTVKLWDIATRKELATLSGHSDYVFSVAFSPDGKTLASASADRTVKLWDIAAHKELATLSGHSGYVLSIAFAPDGKTLASASTDKTMKLWDIAGRKELATLSGHSENVSSVAFSPDGKSLASASADKTVKLWDIATRKEVATLSIHSDYVRSVAFAPDGRTLASASADQTVRLWFGATDEEVEERTPMTKPGIP